MQHRNPAASSVVGGSNIRDSPGRERGRRGIGGGSVRSCSDELQPRERHIAGSEHDVRWMTRWHDDRADRARKCMARGEDVQPPANPGRRSGFVFRSNQSEAPLADDARTDTRN